MLLLRKMCQPILDDMDLKELHVGKSMSGTLAIIGSCGKTVVNIQGIPLLKKTITVAEREYVIELFSAFIQKHNKLLKNYINKRKKMKLTDAPTIDPEVGKFHGGQIQVKLSSKFNSTGSLRYDGTGKKIISYTGKDLDGFIKELSNVGDKFTKIDEYYAQTKKYRELESELNKEIAKLNNCNI